MGRKAAGTQHHRINQGEAWLEPDPIRPGGQILMINGTQSSYVSPDPWDVEFEYMQWMCAGIQALYPPATASSASPRQPASPRNRSAAANAGSPAQRRLRFLHLGGAACTMARWACAHYGPDGAHNLVLEYDAGLAEFVRTELALPSAPQLRIRVADALTELAKIRPGSRDVIIRDIFLAGRTPEPFCTTEYAEQAAAVLAGRGVYVVNCGDTPDLRHARAEAATLTGVFDHVLAVADAAMFKGRRIGNVVYFCSASADLAALDTAALRRGLLAQSQNVKVLNTAEVRAFSGRSR